jgi:hypothetical protein
LLVSSTAFRLWRSAARACARALQETHMSDPAVLVPSGLAQLHPQLETSIKSIATAIRALQSGAKSAVAAPAGGGSVAAAAAQQPGQADGLSQGRGFALFCS